MIETSLRDITERLIRDKVVGAKGANNVLARLAKAEADCVADLLKGVPEAGGAASRKMLEKVVATAFQSGAIHATRFVEHADF
jgi:hypothetical protein